MCRRYTEVFCKRRYSRKNEEKHSEKAQRCLPCMRGALAQLTLPTRAPAGRGSHPSLARHTAAGLPVSRRRGWGSEWWGQGRASRGRVARGEREKKASAGRSGFRLACRAEGRGVWGPAFWEPTLVEKVWCFAPKMKAIHSARPPTRGGGVDFFPGGSNL